MKKTPYLILPVIAGLLLAVSCGQKDKDVQAVTVDDVHIPRTAAGVSQKEQSKMPVIAFETTEYDFGDVIQGERLSYAFRFRNAGKSNLIIYSTDATCGCTTSAMPKAPVRPGGKSEIVVTFDSKNQQGKVRKRILVGANTYPAETILYITADVSKP